MHELDPAEFLPHVQVNLVGAHRLVAAMVPGMVARRRGDIVFISSDVVSDPGPGWAATWPRRTGSTAWPGPCRWSWRAPESGVCVLRPGPTMTGMGMDWDAGTVQAVLDDWGRWGLARHPNFLRPADVATAVAAVCRRPPWRAPDADRSPAGGTVGRGAGQARAKPGTATTLLEPRRSGGDRAVTWKSCAATRSS